MINLQQISLETFLSEFWQKKPLVIRDALPDFINPLSPDELAGLALEEDIESRLVLETPHAVPQWHLKRGPFSEHDFNTLPSTHWTLLVQGVDRLIPEVYALLEHFNFIPQWRVDDIMISYAALHGSVGPHYDNYDVFLYQGLGRREWSLTTKRCNNENYIKDLELRIMEQFDVEERIILEEGDMLYLPPHVGHHGISLTQDCMTYSFGYRSYQGQELLDSLGEYLAEKDTFKTLYHDPDWSHLRNTSEITRPAWQNAQKLLQQLISDEKIMKSWFGCFATQLDQQAAHELPLPLEDDELIDRSSFIEEIKAGLNLIRDASCRFAYQSPDEQSEYQLYINGCEWDTVDVSHDLLSYVANNRYLSHQFLAAYLNTTQNQIFIYNLWKLQWLQIAEN
ncbi:JmjC domain-containing protein [Fluoribacter gormanii]|uniref:50S ribosomal protein L16 3-hydroxylase n=1 Tax=Fluoribacter gormanii TaxID=464 RepID=A0A377GJV9_9GAMM|nr:cupin domain-containing protein [Fluoribacter gormanii]KTD04283.1 cupin [Fluoribacter gormanii]SIR74422.1 50S ribosomal protein L16 3-hydroxylase [Fluoribacter gormanii]STO25109.1 Cupin superfamily protein [Fluoribacter gormanii]